MNVQLGAPEHAVVAERQPFVQRGQEARAQQSRATTWISSCGRIAGEALDHVDLALAGNGMRRILDPGPLLLLLHVAIHEQADAELAGWSAHEGDRASERGFSRFEDRRRRAFGRLVRSRVGDFVVLRARGPTGGVELLERSARSTSASGLRAAARWSRPRTSPGA